MSQVPPINDPPIQSKDTHDALTLKPVPQEAATHGESLGETRNVGVEPLQLQSYSARLRSTLTEGQRNVLHIGCGTTGWIKAVAQDFPGCQALALDFIRHSDLTSCPVNLKFEDDDPNQGLEHLYDRFDVVSIRLTRLRVRDYPRLVEHSSRVLRQGGALEIWESDLHAYDQDHRIIPANTVDPLGTHPWWATLLAYIRGAVDATNGNLKTVSSMEDCVKVHPELGNFLHGQQWVPIVLGDHQEVSADIDTCPLMNEHLLAAIDFAKPLLLNNGVSARFYEFLVGNALQELRRPDRLQYARLSSICASKYPGTAPPVSSS
ncbi:hypothetical protein DFP72DRAFT_1064532 [Ephemerocybe angulata]|uniref:Methyltransferase domain-containing protein n=1 Tax=Ephemerocybe angulata TaxID=980116 RepID=A0A8H6M8N4_9AGAR|nr:hypothetical protein DFP72DRAFT_1064532 [Tulosesus angulatus]